MNLREMLRQYVQFQPRSGISRYAVTLRQRHPQPLRHAEAIHWMIDFERALAALDGQDRTLLLLIHGAGYTHAEAARLTGVSHRSILRKIQRGEDRFHAALDDQLEGRRPIQRCRSRYVQ
jgi:DNA-directed RNA polymerase specialized sigma24 family protein